MTKIPELEGHDHRCVGVAHEVDALTELLKGKQVVLNIVGPLMQLGLPVVQAALASGCHYFDTTGIDTLDLLYDGDSEVSVASTLSLLRMCTKPMYHLEGGELEQWPWATSYDAVVPGVRRVRCVLWALPWGGGDEAGARRMQGVRMALAENGGGQVGVEEAVACLTLPGR